MKDLEVVPRSGNRTFLSHIDDEVEVSLRVLAVDGRDSNGIHEEHITRLEFTCVDDHMIQSV